MQTNGKGVLDITFGQFERRSDSDAWATIGVSVRRKPPDLNVARSMQITLLCLPTADRTSFHLSAIPSYRSRPFSSYTPVAISPYLLSVIDDNEVDPLSSHHSCTLLSTSSLPQFLTDHSCALWCLRSHFEDAAISLCTC